MIVFTHRSSPRGWEFDSEAGGLNGSSRSLQQSLDRAEHSARLYLTYRQGYPVLPPDASREVDHVVSAALANSRATK